jgi:hypothetical protein
MGNQQQRVGVAAHRHPASGAEVCRLEVEMPPELFPAVDRPGDQVTWRHFGQRAAPLLLVVQRQQLGRGRPGLHRARQDGRPGADRTKPGRSRKPSRALCLRGRRCKAAEIPRQPRTVEERRGRAPGEGSAMRSVLQFRLRFPTGQGRPFASTPAPTSEASGQDVGGGVRPPRARRARRFDPASSPTPGDTPACASSPKKRWRCRRKPSKVITTPPGGRVGVPDETSI